MSDVVLSVENLGVRYATEDGPARAVDGASFEVREGEVVGILGETGAGKSTAASGVVRLLDDGELVDGEVTFGNATLVGFEEGDDGSLVPRDEMLTESEMRDQVRGNGIAFVPRDPAGSLNPTYPVGDQVREFVERNRDLSGNDAREEALSMLREAGISDPEKRYGDYPRDLSEGACLRVLVAMALGCRPDLVVADDPTSGVDVTDERGILELVEEVSDEYGIGFLWTTDDPGVAAEVCDRVGVMHLGRIVERGPVEEVFHDPHHPYTGTMLASVPRPDVSVERLTPVEGAVPDPTDPPAGCRFHTRCPDAREACREVDPSSVVVGESGDHEAACIKHDDDGYRDSEPIADDRAGRAVAMERSAGSAARSRSLDGDGSRSGNGPVEDGGIDLSVEEGRDADLDEEGEDGEPVEKGGGDESIEDGERSAPAGGAETGDGAGADDGGEAGDGTEGPPGESTGGSDDPSAPVSGETNEETAEPGDAPSAPDLGAGGGEPVESIKGIGPTYADRLDGAGIETVGDLVTAGPEEAADAAEVSPSRVETWIDRAPVDPPGSDAAEGGENDE